MITLKSLIELQRTIEDIENIELKYKLKSLLDDYYLTTKIVIKAKEMLKSTNTKYQSNNFIGFSYKTVGGLVGAIDQHNAVVYNFYEPEDHQYPDISNQKEIFKNSGSSPDI